MDIDEKLSYEFLYKFYLESNVNGILGDFNKAYFPNDYEQMKKDLEQIMKKRFKRNKEKS